MNQISTQNLKNYIRKLEEMEQQAKMLLTFKLEHANQNNQIIEAAVMCNETLRNIDDESEESEAADDYASINER